MNRIVIEHEPMQPRSFPLAAPVLPRVSHAPLVVGILFVAGLVFVGEISPGGLLSASVSGPVSHSALRSGPAQAASPQIAREVDPRAIEQECLRQITEHLRAAYHRPYQLQLTARYPKGQVPGVVEGTLRIVQRPDIAPGSFQCDVALDGTVRLLL